MISALSTIALLPLASTTTAATTAESAPGQARTYVVPAGSPLPSLSDLRTGAERQLAAAEATAEPTTPLEVVGPAAAYGTKTTIPGVTPRTSPAPASRSLAAPAAVSYPEPARTMSLAECKANMGGTAKLYLKSRFAVCTALQVTTVWARSQGQLGTSSYTVYIRGTVPKESDRTMFFDYDLTDFTSVGTTGAAGLRISLKGVIPQNWPAAARPVLSNTLPVTKTQPQMQASPHYTHTLRYAPGQGSGAGAADLIAAVYQPEIVTTLPPGWVGPSPVTGKPFMFAPRWDAASYLRNSTGGGNPANKGGAAFSMMATLEYSSKAGAPEEAVARHIKQAFTNATATKPLNAQKNVPGDNLNEPLHRLFLDKRRRDRNRAVAVRECTRYWGANYTDGGKECDEFPFATTYEGSAASEFDVHVEKNNFSVLPVPGAQNGAAGNLLSGFYNANRIIDGLEDGFIVKIN
ncbi:NucA/NucB deoxyribonuclease domain-containing protein [Streptomyces sp. MSC1_001]|uniref:NucA/NucB deoxyribonuclease domain-containing protein n=1 Tax=Streptomyces sp. MSC1_001 TaxID=2909263 RepID=UPI00202FA999|nr:NucA/NucB deoxyribonuclease domain-containing protein [Streptomyces sp. MSC1_001]